ncbi:hypothetical protein CCM_06249 [Cordyceps militaris CM01]|uniref:Uncharacterized protein n=1 Tax=Cordyceps militaris (strain CM01) TaxID=983644 RepID=G3JJK1_CORMM|nr:uncharacterized protein CCM_06249 [Cordyceps militaris CM01]EGX92089.1 hypothetical protein CCM_06249 [Cordyceps militaris CM01]
MPSLCTPSHSSQRKTNLFQFQGRWRWQGPPPRSIHSASGATRGGGAGCRRGGGITPRLSQTADENRAKNDQRQPPPAGLSCAPYQKRNPGPLTERTTEWSRQLGLASLHELKTPRRKGQEPCFLAPGHVKYDKFDALQVQLRDFRPIRQRYTGE